MASCPEEVRSGAVRILQQSDSFVIPPGDAEIKFSWVPASDAGSVDLDLIIIMFDAQGSATEAVFYNHPRNSNGSIVLSSGDSADGSIGEAMMLELGNLPQDTAVLTVVAVSADTGISITDSQYVGGLTFSVVRRDPPTTMVWRPLSNPNLPRSVEPSVLLSLVLDRRSTKQGMWEVSPVEHTLRGAHFPDVITQIRSSIGLPFTGRTKFNFPILLQKGSNLNVDTTANGKLIIGVGWDVGDSGDVDVDLSCVALDRVGELVDVVYWGKLIGCDGAIEHLGDNTTGEGEGDDEQIDVDLRKIPNPVHSLAFIISNYSEGNLSSMHNIHFSLRRGGERTELAHFDAIGAGGQYSSFIPCVLQRNANAVTWSLRAISIPANGKSAIDPDIRNRIVRVLHEEMPSIKPVNVRRAIGHTPPERLPMKRPCSPTASTPRQPATVVSRKHHSPPEQQQLRQQNKVLWSVVLMMVAIVLSLLLR
jgi:stress response protein SCP2